MDTIGFALSAKVVSSNCAVARAPSHANPSSDGPADARRDIGAKYGETPPRPASHCPIRIDLASAHEVLWRVVRCRPCVYGLGALAR